MKLKRYKPLILQIGILLLVLSVVLFIVEQQKKFLTVDFTKQYSSNRTIELSGFEEGSHWRGNYSYDSERAMEGKSSIIFSSWYGAKNTINSEGSIILATPYTKGYLSLYIADLQKLQSIESFTLELSDALNNKKNYPLTPLLRVGWNRVPVLIPQWKKITSTAFSLTSKPGKIAELNLDRFWIGNTSLYTSDIIISKNQSLSLRTIGERTYLYSSSPGSELYSFNAPNTISRGSVTISLIPEHMQGVQLHMNGTIMEIGGKGMNECIIKNDANSSSKKILKTVSAKDDLYVFLKGEVKGKNIEYSLSNNGVNFELCGAIAATGKKQIELSLVGSTLIDSYALEY